MASCRASRTPLAFLGEGRQDLGRTPIHDWASPRGCPVPYPTPTPAQKAQCWRGGLRSSLGAFHQLRDIFPRAKPILVGRLVAHHEDPLVGMDRRETSLGNYTELEMGSVRWAPETSSGPSGAQGTPDSQGLLGMRTAGQSPSRRTSATPCQERAGGRSCRPALRTCPRPGSQGSYPLTLFFWKPGKQYCL